MSYLPLADYGMIGDLRTAALVGRNGSIDWCCLPRFDSPSAFAALLDHGRGGRFQITVEAAGLGTQRYEGDTPLLATSFETAGGAAELTDYMPIPVAGPILHLRSEIHRSIRCTRGSVTVLVEFSPRFDYATSAPHVVLRRHGVVATDGLEEAIALSTSLPLDWTLSDGTATARLVLNAGETLSCVLRYDEDDVRPIAAYVGEEKLRDTLAFWERWVAVISFQGPYRAAVVRSAITLKLLCYAETGAIVAAPTTSLPEVLGGERNWDYRYTWLRDTCFTLQSFHAVGHQQEADDFMDFVKRICRARFTPHLQIMYGIDGRRHLPESTLTHLEGYCGSQPVRIGNAAADQLQLDVYGDVMETAFIWSKDFEITEGTWQVLRGLVDWVADHWRRQDCGIWEERTDLKHHVYSKVMCWVALDRGVQLAERHALDGDVARWRREAEACRNEVLANGWDPGQGAFVRSYGGKDLDASVLVMPMVHFLPRTDQRVESTIRAIQRELTTTDGMLVYRYRTADGLAGQEGAFASCTFWLAQTLAMAGDYDSGLRIFEGMLSRSNHVGLYSEEIDPETGAFLGNFPQGLTHIALVNCAYVLERLKPA